MGITVKNKSERRIFYKGKEQGSFDIKPLKSKMSRRIASQKGWITRKEHLSKAVNTTMEKIIERGKFKDPTEAREWARDGLAKYLIKHKDWQKRGGRGSEPHFTY